MIQKMENVLELEVTDGTEPVDFTGATNILLAISQKQRGVYIELPVDVQDGKLVCTLPYKSAMRLVSETGAGGEANQTDNGFYNASDLNRVGAAVEYIAGRFTALGYACPVTVKKDWLTSDAPTASQMEAYRQNIVTLRGQIAVMQSTPNAPASMAGLNYVKANDIEHILLDLDALIDKLIKSWYFSGELYAGEV